MRTAGMLLVLAAVLLLGGCLERTTQKETSTGVAQGWHMAGKFGGTAVVSQPSDDPLKVRYAPGGFKLVSGLDVTANEVWVCDLDISRIQIFDYDGNLKRTIGSGIDAAAVLPTDREDYEEAAHYNHLSSTLWEDKNGQPWNGTFRSNFRAADISVQPDGYWLVDQTRTSAVRNPIRKPGVYFIPNEGDVTSLDTDKLVWPARIATDGSSLAVSDYRGNNLDLYNLTTDPVHIQYVQRGGTFNSMMAVEITFANSPQYLAQHFRFAAGSAAAGSTYMPGGMAFAFGKFAVCDTLNRRVQLFEARTTNANWSKVIREIGAQDRNGEKRFQVPKDIDIAVDGTVFICDSNAAEIVVLDPSFKRLGAFGHGELVEPYAVALSPDGRDCFVTDRRYNMVYHYAKGE